MILLPVHLAVWLMRMAAVLPLWVLGFPACLGLAMLEAWEPRKSRFFTYDDGSPRWLAQWTPVWAYPWGNEEDGIAGPRSFMHGAPAWKRAFVWSAWRNPVNNLRFIYPFGITIDPARIRWRGNVVDSPLDDDRNEGVFRFRWSYTWQGIFAGFWLRAPVGGRVLNFRCGYKLVPKDARGVPDYDYRSKGCGFGLQLQMRGKG